MMVDEVTVSVVVDLNTKFVQLCCEVNRVLGYSHRDVHTIANVVLPCPAFTSLNLSLRHGIGVTKSARNDQTHHTSVIGCHSGVRKSGDLVGFGRVGFATFKRRLEDSLPVYVSGIIFSTE